jgi:pimeloyl-ACP methyl ester carboxylesterase
MAGRVHLGEVTTWYDERGTGEPLVLLHPGGVGVDARAFGPNIDALAAHFHVFTPERRGHGHTADVEGPITFEAMAQDTIAFLEAVVRGPAHVLGYSDGAVVALLAALTRPDLTRRVVLIAGVFHREGWIPQAVEPGGALAELLLDSYAEVSPDGLDHYPIVARKLDRMHAEEPTLAVADLRGVESRTLVMVGDDDEVALEHAVATYRGLPEAELMIVPGTSHGLMVGKPALCNWAVIDFLSAEPVQTLAPIRRAGLR